MTADSQPINVFGEASTEAPGQGEHRGHVVATAGPQARPFLDWAAQAGRFLLHFLEMSVPMGLGMVAFAALLPLLRASPSYGAAFASGADLWILGDGLFMTVPMVAWMVARGHGWQHSLEMGAAMLLPGIAIILLGWLGADAYAPWLAKGACGFMCLGMLVYMLYRHDHFTGQAGHAGHTAHSQGHPQHAAH